MELSSALSHTQPSAPTVGCYHLWSQERHSHWLASAGHGGAGWRRDRLPGDTEEAQ